jgi:hypothetical protein
MWTDMDARQRIERLDSIIRSGGAHDGDAPLPSLGEEVNNHVHTSYSFSPYTPSEAALMARRAGLRAVGIMDHDSVSGGEEFLTACRTAGLASTVGFEVRVNADGTAMEGKKINNPDTRNILYMAVHGIPADRIADADAFLAPLRHERNKRNIRQVEALSIFLRSAGLPELSFEKDVLPVSMAAEGGSVTERHILYALALLLEKEWGRGEALTAGLERHFGLKLSAKIEGFLRDTDNPHYLYDLLGAMKSGLLPRFFIDPDTNECINVQSAVDFARSIGAIPAYAYLGDVTDSPTGDKKAEKFEDGYLDELVPELRRIGFLAVTYMPPRNSAAQLERIMNLCRENGLMQISGVDINSSRQSFHCPEIMDPRFAHLLDATWALIAHEKLSKGNPEAGLFSYSAIDSGKSLEERINVFSEKGRSMFEKGEL